MKKIKKLLAFSGKIVYNGNCCDIDSEEARGCHLFEMGFPWSECQEIHAWRSRRAAEVRAYRKDAGIGKPDGKSLYEPYFLPQSR